MIEGDGTGQAAGHGLANWPARGQSLRNGTDQENGTSFDQMAGAIWRSVTLGFFLLFLWKQLSKFVSFLFFLRFLPRFWDRSGKRSQSLQIMGAIWRDWYGCVLPRVSLEIIFQKSLLSDLLQPI